MFCLWPWALWSRFGVHPVKRFYKIYGEHIAKFAGDADITFSQVKAKFGKELVIPVTNVSKMKVEYCSPQTTPNLPIRKAVRISLSFPSKFNRWRCRIKHSWWNCKKINKLNYFSPSIFYSKNHYHFI